MKRKLFSITVFLFGVFLFTTNNYASGKHEECKSEFVHRGFKLGLSMGAAIPSSQKELDAGRITMIGLGYGFNDHISTWLSLNWSGLSNAGNIDTDPSFGSLELSLKYLILPSSPISPFGRIGIGGYELEEDKIENTLTGYGLNLGVGADYFFCGHFTLGAELQYKNVTYARERIGKNSNFKSLDKNVAGDMFTFMVTFMIQ